MSQAFLPDGFADRIVESLTSTMPSIRAIYIFGSRARGSQRSDSDLDTFALVPEYSASRIKDTVSLYEHLDWLNPFETLDYDLILHDEKTFVDSAKVPGTVNYDVNKEGVKIHAYGKGA